MQLLSFTDVKGNLFDLWVQFFPFVIQVLMSDSITLKQVVTSTVGLHRWGSNDFDLHKLWIWPMFSMDLFLIHMKIRIPLNRYPEQLHFNCGNYLCRDITLKFDYSCFDKCNTLQENQSCFCNEEKQVIFKRKYDYTFTAQVEETEGSLIQCRLAQREYPLAEASITRLDSSLMWL